MTWPNTAEHRRLIDSEGRKADWKDWGPYVSERAWGTVREDYSDDGNAWDYFPFSMAGKRAYRWNEDGLAGVCNRLQNICMSVALWNENDPILKERLFGLANGQGNHGEDVKEYYFYLDNTPTHSYMKMLYKYPQCEFPYEQLIEENGRRGREEPEYELFDALNHVFREDRYFDVFIEYAKAGQQDIIGRVTVINRGPEAAPIHVLPHVWYRNTWSWGYRPERGILRHLGKGVIETEERHMGKRWFWAADESGVAPPFLFTENDTNVAAVFGGENPSPYVKDGIQEAVVGGRTECVNPEQFGSKCAGHFHRVLAPGQEFVINFRLADTNWEHPFSHADRIVRERANEADEFYRATHSSNLNEDERLVQRQAFAGLLWSKQFYHYGVEQWIEGDPATPPPPRHRNNIRNGAWNHLYCLDVLSMPDKWEYPWFAAWDVAFHMLPTALIDPEWAKRQIILFLREWYMHPNGQLPAYEWDFNDANPPVHAWAAWRVYKIAKKVTGKADVEFLEEAFHKLLLNFTWWVNRKDAQGQNIFQGGFLGLDNIGVFDRSKPLPDGTQIEQADGTAWMGMFCLNMLAIALELASHRRSYESVATKFFEHFVYIANAINNTCGQTGLWNEQDGFYYDHIRREGGEDVPLRVRSFVGLIPLFAVETLKPEVIDRLPHFRRRMEWFIKYRPNLVQPLHSLTVEGRNGRRLLSIVDRRALVRVLERMLDPSRFLSEFGVRSLSRQHMHEPFCFSLDGQQLCVSYEPAESKSGLFGGNSNWRGPIWFPVNYLMIESLQKYHHYFGDSLKIEMPRYSDREATLGEVASELSSRLTNIFLRDAATGRRAVFGENEIFQNDPHWRDHIPFFEYFHGETGEGLGASHQTGWTALVAKLLQQRAAES
ncbi:Mannosyl oligosaccharide glucosidase [Planctomycetes bacterium Pan216]|uniref:Mannosyl oligosaccharide glucosidase n=1 Tax=Kolteria novifilia TaxID=2527975 RepID=A0A518B2L8_9BACT|nr:Mannosyl oligosaccharide glucosidase [Planctomycetes bacterium Pan216]